MEEYPEVETFKPCQKPEEHWATQAVRVVDDIKVSSPYWPHFQAAVFGVVTLILLYLTIKSLQRPKIDIKKKK